MIKLSERERKIFIATAALIGLWILYAVAITPLMAQRTQLQTDTLNALQTLHQANDLIDRAVVDRHRFDQMIHYGLASNASAAESQMLHAIGDWASDSHLTLTGNKPDRAEAQAPFEKITFHVTSTGNLASINRFLWDIETSTLPARIEDFTIASRKEGTNDLSLTIAISTIRVVPPTTAPAAGAAASPAGEEF